MNRWPREPRSGNGGQFVGYAALVLLVVSALTAGQLEAQTSTPPIILITVDTLRADHVSWRPSSKATTPQMAELARQGVVFEQVITPVPLTLPAHTSLMTGTYPNSHGVRDNSLGRVPEQLTTLAEILRQAGYRTGAFVGSSVLDHRFGLDQGFQHYSDQFKQGIKRGLDAERRAGEVVDEAIAWLRQASMAPVFLWVHLYDPHSPYEPPAPFEGKGYAGEIEYTDRELGRLFRALEELGLYAPGLITLTGDHGEDLGEHGEPTHGFFLYDTSLRVPLVIKFPQQAHAGKILTGPVSLIDIAPTLLQVLRLQSRQEMQGKGFLGLVLGRSDPPRETYSETLYPNLHFGWNALFSLRDERYKYVQAPHPEFFDLRLDAAEKQNLYSRERALADQYAARLSQLRTRFDRQTKEPIAEVDPELKERLRSLGYATLANSRGVSGEYFGADPKDKIQVYAGIYRGMEAFVRNEFEVSLRELREAIQLDPSVALAHDYLGSTLMALDRPAEAVEAYQAAQKLAPERADTVANLAHAQLRTGDSQAAAAGFELATRLDPRNWQHWQLLGTSQVQNQQPAEALKSFQTALGLSPANPTILFNLGTLYEQNGQFLRGLEVFRRLVELSPESAEAWNGLANCSQGSGFGAGAETAFQRALALRPDYPEAHYNYGNLLVKDQRLDEAVQHYRRSIESNPEFSAAYHNLSVVLELMGKTAESAEAQRKYEELVKPGG